MPPSSSSIRPKPNAMGASTKYQPTGDLKQTISRLQSTLSSIHYPKPLNLTQLIHGSPQAYLPILDWILFSFSRSLAKMLCREYDAAEMRQRSDLRFCEHCWRIFNDYFSWTPAIKVTQFLTDAGFVERKALVIIQLADLVKRRHNQLVRAKRKKKATSLQRAASASRARSSSGKTRSRRNSSSSSVVPVYGTEVVGTTNRPQQYFVERAHQYAEEIQEEEHEQEESLQGATSSLERGNAASLRQSSAEGSAPPAQQQQQRQYRETDASSFEHQQSLSESSTNQVTRENAPSAPEKSDTSSQQKESSLLPPEDATPPTSPSHRRVRFPIYTNEEPTSPLPTAPPSEMRNDEESNVRDGQASPPAANQSYEHASAPPVSSGSEEQNQQEQSTFSNNPNDAILNLLDFKFKQFEKRLEERLDTICDRMDARMTVIEGKMKYLQESVENDRKSQIRIRKVPLGHGSLNLEQNGAKERNSVHFAGGDANTGRNFSSGGAVMSPSKSSSSDHHSNYNRSHIGNDVSASISTLQDDKKISKEERIDMSRYTTSRAMMNEDNAAGPNDEDFSSSMHQQQSVGNVKRFSGIEESQLQHSSSGTSHQQVPTNSSQVVNTGTSDFIASIRGKLDSTEQFISGLNMQSRQNRIDREGDSLLTCDALV